MLGYINSKQLYYIYIYICVCVCVCVCVCCNRLMWMLHVMCQGGEETGEVILCWTGKSQV